MKLTLVPALQAQRDLYARPRGLERFYEYLRVMTGGTDDVVLPIVGMNPMGHPHNAIKLDELIALNAEAIAAAALAEINQSASAWLRPAPASLRVCLVLNDDARGQWTNRYATETAYRFRPEAMLKRGWVIVPCWTSETWSADDVRRETLAAVYRSAYALRHGQPATLRAMMRQEGGAMRFAGAAQFLSAAEIDYAGGVIAPHRETTSFPLIFACLYGDEAAASLGYQPLGLPTRAGFGVALAEAEAADLEGAI